jgi:uncharacterized protein YycO
LVSALIRWQTRGRYSHAAIRMRDGRIVESWQGAGVRTKWVKDWSGIDAYVVPGATDGQWDRAIGFALGQIGRGYDWWAIVRFVSRRAMPANDRWFCSELVFAALAAGGVRLLERVEASAVSPGTLAWSPGLEPERPQVG